MIAVLTADVFGLVRAVVAVVFAVAELMFLDALWTAWTFLLARRTLRAPVFCPLQRNARITPAAL